jgi:hypothetical protein
MVKQSNKIEKLNLKEMEDEIIQSSLPKIALSGKAGAGKSTISKKLALKKKLLICSFAKPMKDMMTIYQTKFGLDCKKDREFLIYIGQHMRKKGIEEGKMDPILRHCLINCHKAIKQNKGIVIDDLRMPQELDYLRKLGFSSFRVVGREHDNSFIESQGGSKTNLTEIALDNVDLPVIDNSEGKKLDNIVTEIDQLL